MAKPMVTDARALSEVITALGGNPINDTWKFNLPKSEVRTVVPKLNALGLGCRKVSEFTESGPQVRSIVTLELYKPDNRLSHLPEW
jgi:hypothetical protein